MEVIGEEQQDKHLQIRGESDSGQLIRTILPDNFLFIPIWNVGSQCPGRELDLGQDYKGGSWDNEKPQSNFYFFETSLRYHLVCFPGGSLASTKESQVCHKAEWRGVL